jgi:hypothetical protein
VFDLVVCFRIRKVVLAVMLEVVVLNLIQHFIVLWEVQLRQWL